MKKVLILSLACLASGSTGLAAEWGSIKGQIKIEGDAPEQTLLHKQGADIKDKEVCAAEDTLNQEVLVDPDTKGIANVFVYLYSAPDDVNPDAVSKADKVIFDQKNCVFKPHAMFIQAGQTIEVLNSDPVAHNTNVIFLRNQQANVLVAPNSKEGSGVEISTVTKESLPTTVKCDFHPWMKAYWLVLDHPYAAVTDSEGRFEIKDLPAGEHEFRLWHEKKGYLDRKYKVTVEAGTTTELDPVEYSLD